MTKFNQYEYQNEVRDKKYDRLELIVPKGMKAQILARAEELGLYNKRKKPNANEYILRLIKTDLEIEKEAPAPEETQ